MKVTKENSLTSQKKHYNNARALFIILQKYSVRYGVKIPKEMPPMEAPEHIIKKFLTALDQSLIVFEDKLNKDEKMEILEAGLAMALNSDAEFLN